MRIGISTSVIQRGKTGVAQYVFALLRAFLPYAKQHQFVLYVLEEDLSLFKYVEPHMQVIAVPERHRPPVRNILWHQTTLPSLARRDKLNVLHIPSYRRLLWSRPCPLVGTIHDLAPFHITGKYDWKRMFYGKVIVRRLAARQDHIIAISANTARDITQYFRLPRQQLTVVHNGLDHERFNAGDRMAAKKLAAEKHGLRRPFFLYLARLEHPAKNHVRLIHAFEEFKQTSPSDWQLVFGGSDWHGAETIHAAIKHSVFANDIRSLGFVSDAELPDLYRAANIFVYPSLYEGFGLPPVEAMACGTPVISSTRGALAEVIGEAAATVDPEDVGAIAAKLEQVSTKPATQERLRAAGLVQAQKFNWNVTASETLNVYEHAAEGQQRPKA